jgi:hypothetical protein
MSTKLTGAERQAAKQAGMEPERYAAMKEVRTLDDFLRARKRLKAAKRKRQGAG